MKKPENDTTNEWGLYQKSKNYKYTIGLYQNCNQNELFYAGDQWNGVVSNGLPTPVFNIFKRVINYFISAILSEKVKMTFVPENIADDAEDAKSLFIKQAGELISSYSETLWEKLKMDSNMRQALLDAALSGDMDGYVFWDPDIDTGQKVTVNVGDILNPQTVDIPIMGDISFQMVDNVNVHFGNPNDANVETQPWIIISFRELVSKLKDEAKANGVGPKELMHIVGDVDNTEQSGEMSKYELETDDESAKTTALVKFWKVKGKDGKTTVHYRKSVKSLVIIPDTDMKISRYPIPHGNWDKRKNCCHGQAVGTGLIPNQKAINKLFAMAIKSAMDLAYPKVVYNKNVIPKWSNVVSEAIAVESSDDIRNVAMYMSQTNMNSQSFVMNLIDAVIDYTKDLIGVTDAQLGDVKPDNTSAIIAVQQASFVPLENIKANLYQWVEDIGYIWLDFMIAKYGERSLTIVENGQRKVIPFDFSQLKDVKFQLKVNVGASSYWSEIASLQTLDRLLMDAKIDFIQYLERIPDGVIPKKEDLINELRMAMQNPPPPEPPAPSTSIKFEDLPIAGQIQLAAQHNIQLTEQDFELMQQAQMALTENEQLKLDMRKMTEPDIGQFVEPERELMQGGA